VNVRRFDDIYAFTERVEPFLMQDEAAHSLILGICSSLKLPNTYDEPPYLAYCEDEGQIVGVAMRTPPFKFILSRMTHEGAVEDFARDACKLYGELPGAIGLKETVATFADCWQRLTGQAHRLNRAERLYRVDNVIPVNGVSGEYRSAAEDDLETMTQWLMAFAAEALDSAAPEDAERNARLRLESDPAVRGMRFWVDDGRPVSMAGYGGLTPHGIRIGPVYTPPEYRGRGYASALTAALSQELLDRGRSFVTLFTDLSNPTSNHIYQMVGYKPVCDVDEYRFEANGHD
jgi:predicted GNAT family acetyltransferase